MNDPTTPRIHRPSFFKTVVGGLALLGVALPAAAEVPYGDLAPWNRSIADIFIDGSVNCDPVHPDSEQLSHWLWFDVDKKLIWENASNFNLRDTYAVFDADEDTPLASILVREHGNLKDDGVLPWKLGWGPGWHSDRQVIVFDDSTGVEYNLFEVNAVPCVYPVCVRNGHRIELMGPDEGCDPASIGDDWQTFSENCYVDLDVNADFRASVSGYRGARGAGIPYGAMLLRPEDFAGERIEHALALRIPIPSGKKYVAPATKLEHQDGIIDGVPIGTRFAFDFTEEEIDTWAKAVGGVAGRALKKLGHALVDYGFFVVDTSWGDRRCDDDLATCEEVEEARRNSETAPNLIDVESLRTAGEEWAELGFASLVDGEYEWDMRDVLDDLLWFRRDRLYAVRDVPTYYFPELGLQCSP